jgi:hypothetical protein
MDENFLDPQKYPNLLEQLKSFQDFAISVGQSAAEGKGVFVSEEREQERIKTCQECNQYNSESKRCYVCGCFMEYKIKFKTSTCPLTKW